MVASQTVSRARSRLHNLPTTQRKTDWHQNSPVNATKARSRLKKKLSKPHFSARQIKLFRSGLPRFFPSKTGLLELLNTFYLQRKPYLFFLVLGLIFSCLIGVVLTSIAPQNVANFPLYQSYGIVILLIFFTASCFSIFFLSHFRRGVLVGLLCAVVLLLHFQNFTLQTLEFIAFGIFFLVIELFLTLAEKLGGQIKPRPHHHRRRV
jgi:hypothetical protein